MARIKVLPDVDKWFQVGGGLNEQEKVEMLLLLVQNVDVFAWSPYEVPGVDPEFIVHRLRVDPLVPPKKQKPRRSAWEHTETVKAEVRKLKDAGAIREIFFPDWLANTVVVKKKSGYHQIALAPEDQEKTAFISPEANYHYTVMPFRLKNAKATYQQMMTRMFRDMIGRTVEVYIDNIVVKSKQTAWHTNDLRDVFEIKAVKRLNPPNSPKEVQVLTGMLAALNRFISKFADRCRLFYQLLKKWTGFQWNEECDKAFMDLKDYLSRAPMLTAPELGEDLFMYLAVSEHAVSAVLLRDQGVQQPVYYISKTLVDAETRYLTLEKLVLALIHATRKLPQYFQAHTVYVLIEYPLQSLLRRSDFTGRIAKWGTRLGSFDIRYRPRNSVKGQILADFVAKFSPRGKGEIVCHVEFSSWKVFVDGASNYTGASAGVVIVTPEGIRLEHSFKLRFRASNNEAKYEALLAELRTVSSLGAQVVEVYSDSRLVVSQVEGSFEARDLLMKAYLEQVKRAISGFSTVRVIQVARTKNRHADSLAMLALLVAKEIPRLIRVEVVPESSIRAVTDLGTTGIDIAVIPTMGSCWMDPIMDFLADGRLPSDEKEGRKIRRMAPRYSTPAYPQGNGQAEVVNKVIVSGLKKRLKGAKGNWAEELAQVLWVYRTTLRRSTGETPCSLTYGAEAVIPTEVDLCSARVARFDPGQNDEMMVGCLDGLEEFREVVTIRLAEYQQKLAQRYSRDVRMR
nr:uncharacterized protein LOC112007441 [Quercus suber]